MGRFSVNAHKPFGSASVTSTVGSAGWTPAAGKAINLAGAIVSQLSAGVIQYDLTNGTEAAAGTIFTFGFAAAGGPVDIPIGKSLSADKSLGIKARAGAGSIIATWYGREY